LSKIKLVITTVWIGLFLRNASVSASSLLVNSTARLRSGAIVKRAACGKELLRFVVDDVVCSSIFFLLFLAGKLIHRGRIITEQYPVTDQNAIADQDPVSNENAIAYKNAVSDENAVTDQYSVTDKNTGIQEE